MLISLDTSLFDPDDKPIVEDGKPVTSGKLFKRALLSDVGASANAPLSTAEKVRRYELYLKIKQPSVPSPVSAALTVEDVALLNEAIGCFGTLVMGQLRQVLNSPISPAPVAIPSEPVLDCAGDPP